MNTTPQAAVHLGRDFLDNLRLTKRELLRAVKQLFQVTEKLIKNQTEISGLTTIHCEEFAWSATSLLCDKAFSDRECENLRLRQLGAVPGKHERRTDRSLEGQKLNGIGRIAI